MSRTRDNFKKQFTVRGVRLRASVHRNKDGGWKIFSVGALDIPTALLPFEVQQVAMELIRSPAFETDNQAIAALLDAGR